MKVVIGMGSNLGDSNHGDRLATMRAAAREIGRVAKVIGASSVVETPPAGGPPQPDYLNAAILVDCTCTPHELLAALAAIEASLGRKRDVRWGPRTIDLDVLWIEDTVVDSPELQVPHPRLADRAFAVAPLLELVPGATDPRTGRPYEVPAGEELRRTDHWLL